MATWGLPAHPGGPQQLVSISCFLKWPGARSFQHLSLYPLFFPSSPPTSSEEEVRVEPEETAASLATGSPHPASCGLLGGGPWGAEKRGSSQWWPTNSHRCFFCFLINKPRPFFMYLLHIYIFDRKMRAVFYPHTMSGTFGVIHYEN